MRDLSFRYVIIRNGADYGTITPANNGGASLRAQQKSEIKMSLSGSFLPTVYDFDGLPMEGAAVDWLTDQIRPEMILDGTAHPLGVYLPATVSEEEPNDGTEMKVMQVEAYDRCWQVKDNYTQTVLYFAANTSYLDAVLQLLASAGIALISATPSDATLAEERQDWNIGTSYLTIINELLAEINYNPLWFNASGAAILEPADLPTAQNIDHVIDDTDPETLLLPGIRKSTDTYSAPNVFLCICSSADKDEGMAATSENNNPQSPLSIQRRGRRIMKVVNVNNIADQTELQAYADRLRNESMITGETITVRTALLPGYGVGDVTGLRMGETFAICIERSWSMDLRTGGTMTHELEKVVISLD